MHRSIKARSSWVALGLAAVLAVAACTDSASGRETSGSPAGEQPPQGTTLPTAPPGDRVDRATPSFSNPTTVDNPWFPISSLESAILLGNDDGHPLRIETTLLPDPKVIEVNGEKVETLVSQFVSYIDGRLHEVALDWYGQADDGSVWYFGEDVFNYEDGAVADTDGTWRAGKDGPVAMIMPADPQVGDVYRPENIPGSVFEEVTVKTTGLTVQGPTGPVEGAIVGTELHLIEGHYEDKTFAPGYGEFSSGVSGNLEAMALAVPTDARTEPVPPQLATISTGAITVLEAAQAGDWDTASAALNTMRTAWDTYRVSTVVPPLLDLEMTSALEGLAGNSLVPAVDAQNVTGAGKAAVDAAQAALDLQLQFRPPADIDQARFDLWIRQLEVDAGGDQPEPAYVAGDVSVLEWTWDRIAYTYDDQRRAEIEDLLVSLRKAADNENTNAATKAAERLQEALTG